MPRILTHSVIPTLAVTALDAGDVVECYHLTRTTFLDGTSIKVTKSALGVRYRRPHAETVYYYADADGNSVPQQQQQRLELTLEFGAARGGPDLLWESFPRVVWDSDGESSSSTNIATNETTTVSPRNPVNVTWDNAGRVYYTERIDSTIYTSANYLASLSGTVLTKMLQSAMDFVTLNPYRSSSSSATSSTPVIPRVRRYQPFAVYMVPSPLNSTSGNDASETPPHLLLHSSNDADFVHYVIQILAELGVAIQPVILPTTYQVRLHATSMHKVKAVALVRPVDAPDSPADPPPPIVFYQQFIQCVQAIASANYSVYNNTALLSPLPSDDNVTSSFENGSNHSNSAPTAARVATPSPLSMIVRPPHRLLQHDRYAQTSAQNLTASTQSKPQPISTPAPKPTPITLAPIATKTSSNDTAPVDDQSNQESTTDATDSMETHQKQAATAAQQAQQAAVAAGAAGTEEDAVSAAQQAAVYAHKAATVTAQQAASMARDAIQSGVGSSVAQAVALCFSDPLYGIASATATSNTVPSSPTNSTSNATLASNASSSSAASTPPKRPTTTAYIYWDGVYYYQVELTAPYVTVTSSVQSMPQPPVMGIGREDFVDWAIALLLLACAAIGFLLLLQQVMGRNLKVIRPLYRYQRWFFAPTQFAWKDIVGATDDNESISTRGVGQQYTFGEDVIPLSMGGRPPSWFLNGRNNSHHSVHHSFDDDDNVLAMLDDDYYDDTHDTILGDLELTESGGRPRSPTNLHSQSYDRGLSFHSENSAMDDDLDLRIGGGGGGMGPPPIRLYRDPNLVDLPDCKWTGEFYS
jgi:hypothetical protein